MSGFSGIENESSYKIATYMIQSLFPPINIDKVNLDDCKRVVVFCLKKPVDGGLPYIEFRHYAINGRQRDVAKGIKRIINSKKIPNLKNLEDISDLLLGSGANGMYSSESEAEDLPDSKVQLGQDF